MTTFSVIIPTHNRREHLMACLASVSAQRRRPDEVIVVDDGSTDGTLAALAGIDSVTVIRQPNAGAGAARNRGAAAASGDYLAFLDSDDLWFPWSLETLAALIARHDRPSLLFARFADFADPAELDVIASPDSPSGIAFGCYLASAGHGYFVGAGMMVVARAVFERAGGFVEDRLNAEDHDLALRLGVAPGFVQVAAPVTLAHRIHSKNAMGNVGHNAAGVARLIASEKRGAYPGGERYRLERQRLLSMHTRPAVLACARNGQMLQGWRLYRETLWWQMRERRLAFLALAPPLLAMAGVRPARSRA
jgi:glycosyltransferase involved in cell wall biosynthesis